MKMNFSRGVGGLCHTCGNSEGVGGSSVPCKNGKSREVGGPKWNSLRGGGLDIFWNYTLSIFKFRWTGNEKSILFWISESQSRFSKHSPKKIETRKCFLFKHTKAIVLCKLLLYKMYGWYMYPGWIFHLRYHKWIILGYLFT